MALSKDELLNRITKWRNKDAETSELVKQGILFDNLSDYLNDTFEGEQWDEEAQDYTPEYAKHEEDVLKDLGLSWEDVSALADYDVDNPVTSETIIDKDGDGDADITVTEQDDGNDGDESLVIGGTDIFKEPFTEEQLAILRNDDDFTKFSGDELKALYKSDFAKARKARNAWIKRARELLEGESSDKPHDQGLAGETTPEEEAMLALASGESKPNTGLAGETTPNTGLAGETTLEEDLMLNPDMSPSEFSKKAAEKRGAKPGEPAPDFNNFTNDIAKNLASRRW